MMNITCLKNIVDLYKKKQQEKNDMIQKALNHHNLSMLHVDEFIRVTGFKLPNTLSLDLMWNNFKHDIPIYITDELIKVFGYKGLLGKQKEKILNLVKKYNIPIIQLNNNEYEEFLFPLEGTQNNDTNNEQKEQPELNLTKFYPKLSKSAGKGKTIHNLIMPRDLKKLMLVVNTDNGDAIREYVISLDELFQIYLTYQREREVKLHDLTEKYFAEEKRLRLEERKLADEDRKKADEDRKKAEAYRKKADEERKLLLDKLDETREDLAVNQEILTEMNNKFDAATDDRAPKTKSIGKRDKFMIIKINKPDYQWKYYVIRVQQDSLRRTLKKLKAKYPNYTEFITIPYQPNGINFFNLLKEKLRNEEDKIIVNRNEIKLKTSYSEEQFLQDIKDLDISKKEISLQTDSDNSE